MKSVYVFDLDGTIADIEHRRPLLDGDDPDWHSFHQACIYDTPNAPVVRTLRALVETGFEILILSGRTEDVRSQTMGWLHKYQLPYDALVMRPKRDNRPDEILKEEWIEEYDLKTCVVAVFDDRDKVVEMWRDNGIPCFQVAPGDF